MGLEKKNAVSVNSLISAYIKEMGLVPGLNTQRIFAAWDNCSGAGPFTLKRFFRSGTLYITLNSSMVRDQLSFQKEILVEKMNAYLAYDELFTDDNRTVGYIQKLVLK